MKRKAIVIAVIVIVLAGAWAWRASGTYGTNLGDYYVEVSNANVVKTEQVNGDATQYSYILAGVKDDGTTTQVRFSKNEEVADGTYLRLKMVPFFGATGSETVDWSTIPTAAQAKLPAPSEG